MALHPFPQLARPGWFDLGGPWEFRFDDGDVGVRDAWHDPRLPYEGRIIVPFPPESPASGIGDQGEHAVLWYRRRFRMSDAGDLGGGRRVLLHFGAVDYSAHVWVNGVAVGTHEGGHSSFTLDITEAARQADDVVIVVRAEDRPRDVEQPRGKQYWGDEPRDIWYHRTSGIWQPVWLEVVGGTHIAELRWTPDPHRPSARLDLRLNREPLPGTTVRLRMRLHREVVAEESWRLWGRDTWHEVALPRLDPDRAGRFLLWSPGNPNLVDAELLLEDEEGRVLDEVISYVGIRSIETDDGYVLLNGSPVYLRLVLSQGYWPSSHLAAPSPEALREEVEAVRMLGFNGVRIHQKVEDPRFLYWCDRLGLFVWSEMASAYVFSEDAAERFVREWLQVVRRDYSHPSIVAWVPFNESWGVPNLAGDGRQRAFVRSVYELTRALDGTRPVIGNDGWEHDVGDIWGIHDYGLDGASLRERYGTAEALAGALAGRPAYRRAAMAGRTRAGEPVVLSEFGGITYSAEPGSSWFGYGTVVDEAAYLARYRELVEAVVDSPVLAGFCYTQLTDTEQERNGLLTADRRPKLDPAAVARITRRPARAISGQAVAAVQATEMAKAASAIRPAVVVGEAMAAAETEVPASQA